MADLTTYREAVAEGIAREMRRDPSVVCLGEDAGVSVSLPLVEDAVVLGDETRLRQLFLNLITNAVVVWNTVYMQAALEALREEGYAVKDEDLVHLSPARFAHIHRYGKYHFDVETARSRRGLRPLRR